MMILSLVRLHCIPFPANSIITHIDTRLCTTFVFLVVKNRPGADSMIGKKVPVFWPVDEQWHEGTVEEYNQSTGEHKLRYEDGDTEWVKIGDITGGKKSSHSKKDGEKTDKSAKGGSGGAPESGTSSAGNTSANEPPEPSQSPTMQKSSQQRPSSSQQQHQPPPPLQPGLYMDPNAQYPFPHTPFGPPGGPTPYPGMPYPPAGPYPPVPPYYPHAMPPAPGVGMPSNRISPDKEKKSPKSGSPHKKNPPKTWSKEEDAQLLGLVQRMRIPVKWSFVAQNMNGRSGKQCRERYVNHLNPRLKSSDWDPIEDATIFHLYNTCGSQWAKMSKMIPGRTDNGIKNRFHNLRRQLEREDEQRMRLSKSEDFPEEIRLDHIRPFPEHMRGKADKCWDMFESLGVLAAQSVLGGSLTRNANKFGPFKKADPSGEQCARCGLYAPSTHCGTEICTKSGWCIACTRVPPHLCGNLLRECLNLRRIIDDQGKDQKPKTDTESLLKTGALVLAQD